MIFELIAGLVNVVCDNDRVFFIFYEKNKIKRFMINVIFYLLPSIGNKKIPIYLFR